VQIGEGAEVTPGRAADWDGAAKPSPDFDVDQRVNWLVGARPGSGHREGFQVSRRLIKGAILRLMRLNFLSVNAQGNVDLGRDVERVIDNIAKPGHAGIGVTLYECRELRTNKKVVLEPRILGDLCPRWAESAGQDKNLLPIQQLKKTFLHPCGLIQCLHRHLLQAGGFDVPH
jgi:hypothetical protein